MQQDTGEIEANGVRRREHGTASPNVVRPHGSDTVGMFLLRRNFPLGLKEYRVVAWPVPG